QNPSIFLLNKVEDVTFAKDHSIYLKHRSDYIVFLVDGDVHSFDHPTLQVDFLSYNGKLSVEYLIIKPLLGVPSSFAVSREKFWREQATVTVGHRGLGRSYTKFASVRENTIASFDAAASCGADFVEFDVQLTKDLVPIVYHDFFVYLSNVSKASKDKDSDNNYDLHRIPIKSLELRDLQELKVGRLSQTIMRSRSSQVTCDDDVIAKNQPFPTLAAVLQSVTPSLGFNIEIKYPLKTVVSVFQ
ncbi:unnamed protein product, partial [Soboliphyme baturini]|uniref:Glycerophosphocholine phosphodiesterase n=1 Tax=Soboliphyme baturini TaxID=241478 RepID=A0A183J6Z4_9BILA